MEKEMENLKSVDLMLGDYVICHRPKNPQEIVNVTAELLSVIERQDMYNEFHKILIKHDFDKHTSVPTHALMDFLWKWFNELPIFPNEFDKLNENYPPQMEGVKKEYV